VNVWVNPTRKFLAERDRAIAGLDARNLQPKADDPEKQIDPEALQKMTESFNAKMFDWYARLWSKGADAESHWTADEVKEVSETDPALFNWMVKESSRMMADWRAQEKKS
jgi:hypothetical protein